MKKNKVICILPKAGLGNQLFPLLNALVFSQLNDLELIIIGYHQLKIGPYLRKEKIKRTYIGYFNFQKNVFNEGIDRLRVWLLSRMMEQVHEPKIEKLAPVGNSGKLFIFKNMPTYFDYFIHLKKHRDEVKKILHSILKASIKEEISKINYPIIGVHIRMGDFRKLRDGEDFSKVGHVRTPENYFIELIKNIREISRNNLPVTIFSDGYRHEFDKIFELGNVELSEGNSDITDLILLSKSKILLNVHYNDDWKCFEQIRCFPWLNTNKIIVSESSYDEDDRVIFVDCFENLPEL